MKPIETVYAGYRFRSRLEARWAVFFDALGIRWEYEKEGYDLDGVWYLPDFWLPEQDCWIEIKGQNPTPDEFNKAFLLAWHSDKPVYLFAGEIGDADTAYCAHYTFGWVSCAIIDSNEEYQVRLTAPYKSLRNTLPSIKGVEDLATQQAKLFKNLIKQEQYPVKLGELHVFFPYVQWIECLNCHKPIIIGNLFDFKDTACKCAQADGWDYAACDTERAYTAARQARFEHGEAPRF